MSILIKSDKKDDYNEQLILDYRLQVQYDLIILIIIIYEHSNKVKEVFAMNSANICVREAAKKNKVTLWAVADYLGISEATMTRKLRRELPDAEQAQLIEIIKSLGEGGGDSGRT